MSAAARTITRALDVVPLPAACSVFRPAGTVQRHQPVDGEERDAQPAHHLNSGRGTLHDHPDAGDPGGDEHDVGHRADDHDDADVLATQTLPEHVRVLRPDRDDQGEAGDDGPVSKELVTSSTLGRGHPLDQRMFRELARAWLHRHLDLRKLSALLAIADLGTFDAAARHLHVTPSAVSQRIRALESAVGQVLVQRWSPCVPTPAGERLVGVARQTQLLLSELSDTAADDLPTALPVAVNADSLATWFRPVLDELGTWDGVALRLFVEDQAYSGDLLRRGEAWPQ